MKKRIAALSAACLMTLLVPMSSFADTDNSSEGNSTEIEISESNPIEIKEAEFRVISGDTADKVSNIYYVPITVKDSDGNELTKEKHPFGDEFSDEKLKDIYVLVAELKDGSKKAYISSGDGLIKELKIENHSEVQYSDGNIPSYISVNLGNEEKELKFEAVLAEDGSDKNLSGKIELNTDKKIPASIKYTIESGEKEEIGDIYKVPVKLLKRYADEPAKGGIAVISEAVVVEKDGKSTIYIDTVGLEGEKNLGFIMEIYDFQGENNSVKTKANIAQTVTYETNKKLDDGTFQEFIKPKVFKIDRDKTRESEIIVNIVADDTSLFETEGRLVFDYNAKKEGSKEDLPQDTNISGGEKKIIEEKKPGADKPPTTPKEGGNKNPKPSAPTSPKAVTTTNPAPAGGTNKLPQTGSPIDTVTMLGAGFTSLAAGIWLYKKK